MHQNTMSAIGEQRRQGGEIRGAGVGALEPARNQSEIVRELERLRRADDDFAQAVEMLWDRMERAGVLAPQPELVKPAPPTAVEAAHSALGNELQNRAFAVQAKVNRLHELMHSMCL